MKKVLFTIVLLLSFSVLFSQQVFGSETDRFVIENDYVLDTETGDKYIDGVQVTNGNSNNLSLEELKQLFEEQEKEKNIDENRKEIVKNEEISPNALPFVYVFNQTGTLNRIGSSKKVSADLACPSSGSDCSISVSKGWSISESFSLNYGHPVIRAGASFSWNKSVTRSTSYNMTIPSGKNGHVRFFPYLNRTYGYVKTYNGNTVISNRYVYADSPKKTANGQPDGTFFVQF
ncbi:DUF6060 domain-containing protein [Gracilibacillus timonensis]|uniref:DUF6060 domain-containing protein n=1 Tax=Gracilibacillus timonensis TaxID=1816696 RepID=UPI0008240B57|nr:hypothetical protein [Gracilibacillus timonensis]